MSRLLFAAARGARIQYRSPIDRNWKESAFRLWPDLHDCKTADSLYRIHPNDEHLQYGPISTALLEMAEDSKYNSSWEHFLANAAANEFTEFFDSRTGEPDYPFFYLILAEALADSGL
jgi:hypothetical protein